MTDTRKEFGDYFFSSNPLENLVGYEREVALEAWQACQQLNDKRITDLLAVIHEQHAALAQINRLPIADSGFCYAIAKEALAITPESVELVEVNHVDYVDVDPAHYDVVSTLDDGEKLYKIQMKGK